MAAAICLLAGWDRDVKWSPSRIAGYIFEACTDENAVESGLLRPGRREASIAVRADRLLCYSVQPYFPARQPQSHGFAAARISWTWSN
jgi:hypothetical protein